MLHTEMVILQLDEELERSGTYDKPHHEKEALGNDIQQAWHARFTEALQKDFLEQAQVNVLVKDTTFELSGDQGASVWRSRIIAEDDTATLPLSFWIKATINYQHNKLRLEEDCIRWKKYPGTDTNAERLFKKLKSANSDGYETGLSMKELFVQKKTGGKNYSIDLIFQKLL
jgi:hypothetical protein